LGASPTRARVEAIHVASHADDVQLDEPALWAVGHARAEMPRDDLAIILALVDGG
jgi:hypothetical protein